MSVVQESSSTARPAAGELEGRLEAHRSELTAYCYRMLASPFEAEDAVQETFIRAWRSYDRFEGRAALRSWLYRIATNVCLDMLSSRERRALPMDLGPAQAPVLANAQHPARDDVDPADPRRPRRAGGRSRRRRGRARDDPPGVRRRPAAPAAAPARRADPVRGAALEGDRGRRAARDERRLGQQRAAACARDARGEQGQRERSRAGARRRRPRAAGPLRRRVRALRHGCADGADPARTRRSRCRRTTSG